MVAFFGCILVAFSLFSVPFFLFILTRLLQAKSPETLENTRKNLGTIAVPRFSFWQRVKDSNIYSIP